MRVVISMGIIEVTDDTLVITIKSPEGVTGMGIQVTITDPTVRNIEALMTLDQRNQINAAEMLCQQYISPVVMHFLTAYHTSLIQLLEGCDTQPMDRLNGMLSGAAKDLLSES